MGREKKRFGLKLVSNAELYKNLFTEEEVSRARARKCRCWRCRLVKLLAHHFAARP